MASFKKFKKKFKKTFAAKALKSVGRVTAKAVKYGSIPLGAALGGPIGAALGTAAASAASQVGPNKNRGAALRRTLVTGGAVTVGTAALGIASGAGIGASLISSAESLFGSGNGAQAMKSPGAEEMTFSHDSGKAPAPGSSAGTVGDVAAAAAAALTGQPTGAQKQYLDQLALAEKLREQGDLAGAAQAEALAETYRQLIEASGQTVPSPGFGISPWLVGGGILALFLLSRGKAA